jgi:hypothetical protein
MTALLRHFLGWFLSTFRSREVLILENLALRQQLLALHTRRPRRRLSKTGTSYSGLLYEESGSGGRNRSCWSNRERLWLGIGRRASGCTGDGSREQDK